MSPAEMRRIARKRKGEPPDKDVSQVDGYVYNIYAPIHVRVWGIIILWVCDLCRVAKGDVGLVRPLVL